jgi:branched-chain amino acid transport system ATP-binding protein
MCAAMPGSSRPISDAKADVLELADVSVSYGKIRAVHGVSLAVRAGEVVALLGSNGAGKSTLLRTIAGVVHPEAGRVVFDGTDITRLPSHRIARRGLRLVPEGRGLLARMTVRENLLMGQYTQRRVDATSMEAVLARFPVLRTRRDQIASTLSGGEQQMLAIARAVVGAPRLLMLDEPSLGLAPLMVDAIFEVVRTLKEDGATILLVEQNARKALHVADRAYILETGAIVLEGPARELAAGAAVQRAYLGGL